MYLLIIINDQEGTGAMWDFEEGQAPWAKSATTIDQVYMPDKMTSIGSFCFRKLRTDDKI